MTLSKFFGLFVLAFLSMAHTNSTNVGRMPIAHPDLGHDGGASLHTKMNTIFTDLSNHLNSRYFEFSLANAAFADFTHNFQTPFADIGYELYWRAGTGELTRITDTTSNSDCGVGAPVVTEFTIAGGPDTTDQVRVTNNTGETCLLALLITQNKGISRLKDLTDVDTTGVTNNQPLVYNSGTQKWEDKSFASALNTASTGAGQNDLNDTVITAAANGDIIQHNGTNWVDTTLPTAADAASTGIALDNINNVTAPSPQDGQALVYNNSLTRWEPGASGDASFKIQSVSTPNVTIKGGSMLLSNRTMLATYDGSGTTEADYSTDLTCSLTTILGASPSNATYTLSISRSTLGSAQLITDSGRRAVQVTCTNFHLTTQRADMLLDGYIPIGTVVGSGGSWSSSFALSTAYRTVPEPNLTTDFAVINLLANGYDFENDQITTQYLGGGTGSFTTTTPGLDGSAQAGIISASSNGSTITGPFVAIPPALKGKACRLKFPYHIATSAPDWSIKVTDGTNDLFTAVSITAAPSSGPAGIVTLGFVCPTSGSIQTVFTSLVSSPASLTFDRIFLGGDPDRGVLGDQAETVYDSKFECSTQPTRAIGSIGAMSGSGCTTTETVDTISGSGSSTAPAWTFTFPPGRYHVAVIAPLTSAGAQNIQTALTDDAGTTYQGRNLFSVGAAGYVWIRTEGYFNYTTQQTKTIALHNHPGASTSTLDSAGPSSTRPTQVIIERFPNQSPRDTVTLETQGTYWQGTIVGTADAALGTTNDTSAVEISDANLTLATYAGSAAANITCATTNVPGTTTCPSSNESVGFSPTVPYAGVYRVCFDVVHRWESGASTNANQAFAIVETPTNAQTVLQTSAGIGGRATPTGAAITMPAFSTNICHNLTFSSAGVKAIRLFEQTNVTTGPAINTLMLNSTSTDGRKISFTMFPLTQQFPQAVALTELDPTKVTSAAAATKMGLKTYLVNTVYANGTPTITTSTNTTAIGTIFLGQLIPYQTFDGTWRMKANLYFQATTSSATEHRFNIGGVSALASSDQAFYCHHNANVIPIYGMVNAGGSPPANVRVGLTAANNPTEFVCQADIHLSAKPTWAD